MMTKRYRWLTWLTAAAILLAGCGLQEAVTDEPVKIEPKRLSDEPVTIEFWAYYEGWEGTITAFQQKYPNVTVNLKTFSFNTYTDEYLKAIADGNPPDVMLADSEQFGQFTAINGLEDLTSYGADSYREGFSESLWNSNLSFDGSKLIGFPLGTSPLVTYYRADILKQYGFPSEPEELGRYMENPDHWLKMAQTLKKDQRYITQWSPEVVDIFSSTSAMFDSDMNFLRNNDTFIEAVGLAKEINSQALEAAMDVWTPSGAQAVHDGQIAMLYLGTWGAAQIKEWDPDGEGQWRETRLPFNLYGWENSSNFMMPSAGQNKEWAWKFIEYCVTEWTKEGDGDGVPAYIPAREIPKNWSLRMPISADRSSMPCTRSLSERCRNTI